MALPIKVIPVLTRKATKTFLKTINKSISNNIDFLNK